MSTGDSCEIEQWVGDLEERERDEGTMGGEKWVFCY
jgi:hypothetical protein